MCCGGKLLQVEVLLKLRMVQAWCLMMYALAMVFGIQQGRGKSESRWELYNRD